jgi:hypothetical protein
MWLFLFVDISLPHKSKKPHSADRRALRKTNIRSAARELKATPVRCDEGARPAFGALISRPYRDW